MTTKANSVERADRFSKGYDIKPWKLGERPPKNRWNRFPRDVFMSADYHALSAPAKSLLIYFLTQFNGHNNGQLEAPLSKVRDLAGWGNSARTLAYALRELNLKGWIQRTRGHSRSQAAQYHLTHWFQGGKRRHSDYEDDDE